MSEEEQNKRDMEVMQNLFRESTRREALAAEITELKREVAVLEKRNEKLSEAAKSAPKRDPAEDEAKEKALREELRREQKTRDRKSVV